MKSARSERDLCKTRLSNARVAKGAENGACGSPAKQFQNLPGMTEPCRTRVDRYTDSPPVRKLWGGILPRSGTSAFPRDASGGFTRCCYLSHCVGRGGARLWRFVDNCRIVSDEGRARLWRFCRYLSHCVGRGESAALAFLSISVALCRSRVRARLWCFCRYLSHCVGRGGAMLWCFVDICRIMSDEGKSTAFAFLSITVVLCRSRWRARLWCFCRYLSHCVGRGESAAIAFLSI